MKNKKLIKTILIILIYLIWLLFLPVPLDLFNLNLNYGHKALYEFIITLILLITIVISYKDELLKELNFKNKKNNKFIFINIISIIFLMGIFDAMSYSILGDKLIFSVNNENLSIIGTKNILSIVRMIILSPIVEELVFRKNLRSIIKDNNFFIMFSGLLLGMFYIASQSFTLIGFISSIKYIIVGIYLSYSYVKTDNIYINMISRIIYNLLMLVVLL